jgi:hypothetical protein
MDIPYLRTCMTIVGPLGILVIVLLGVFNFQFALSGLTHGSSGASTFLLILCFYSVLISVFYILFSKAKLSEIQISEQQIQSAKRFVPVLFVLLLILLTVSLIIKGIEKGTL